MLGKVVNEFKSLESLSQIEKLTKLINEPTQHHFIFFIAGWGLFTLCYHIQIFKNWEFLGVCINLYVDDVSQYRVIQTFTPSYPYHESTPEHRVGFFL